MFNAFDDHNRQTITYLSGTPHNVGSSFVVGGILHDNSALRDLESSLVPYIVKECLQETFTVTILQFRTYNLEQQKNKNTHGVGDVLLTDVNDRIHNAVGRLVDWQRVCRCRI